MLLVAALALVAASVAPRTFEAGRFGTVTVFEAQTPTHLLFLFSDTPGWGAAVDEAARTLVQMGAVVVGVDLSQYLRGLAASDDGCHYVVAEIEALSQRLQRELGFARYESPILAGIGAGATMAYAALAQAPAATIGGAASVDPAPLLRTKVPLCPGAPAHAAAGGGFGYGPRAELPGWWRVSAPEPLPPDLAALTGGVRNAVVTPANGRGSSQRLVDLLRPALVRAADDILGQLPLIDYPVASPGQVMAVIYSGDGGWRDLDKEIAEILAKRGVPVVGVDSLRYFWRKKTAEQVSRDLAEVLRAYRERWSRPKVLAIGYSFGADILPFAITRLPEELRAAIVQISLLGVESTASFEFKIAGWFTDASEPNAPRVLPEVLQLDLGRIQCFFGSEEEDTICRAPEMQRAEIIGTTGGHHFDENYPALAEKILDGLQRRLPRPTPSVIPRGATLPPRP